MRDIAVADTSFLVNVKRLQVIEDLCNVFSELYIPSTVWDESFQFQSQLERLPCVDIVELTPEEKEEVEKLHEAFTEIFSGTHRGEIEAFVLAKSRGYSLVISDNFAPWYLRKQNLEYSNVLIYRGTYYFARLIELGLIDKNYLQSLEGTYPAKEIRRLKEGLK